MITSKISGKYFGNFQTYSLQDLTSRYTVEGCLSFCQTITACEFLSVNSELKVLESERITEIPKWFIGSKLNYAENLLRYDDNRIALITTGMLSTCDILVCIIFSDSL